LLNTLVEQAGGSGEGFDVARNGDARVALIDFPSVGKSTLLGALTTTDSIRNSRLCIF
jgi:ribosome-interacting GTPase 1